MKLAYDIQVRRHRTMQRKYLEALREWNKDPYRKPMIVWGARQVGKTYLVKDLFAEQEYKGRYIYVDCRVNFSNI